MARTEHDPSHRLETWVALGNGKGFSVWCVTCKREVHAVDTVRKAMKSLENQREAWAASRVRVGLKPPGGGPQAPVVVGREGRKIKRATSKSFFRTGG